MQAEGEDGQLSPHVVPRQHVETYNQFELDLNKRILLYIYIVFLIACFVAPIFCPAGNTSGHYAVMPFNFGPSDATLPENHDIDSLRWNPL